MAEEVRLESVYTGNRIEGSNPSLSALFWKEIFLSAVLLGSNYEPCDHDGRSYPSLSALFWKEIFLSACPFYTSEELLPPFRFAA